MTWFDMLSTGIAISLGALFVSVTDSPGPLQHRRNGMTVCTAALLIVTLITGFTTWVNCIICAVSIRCLLFLFMIGIYGARAGSIGTVAMLVITLTLDPRLDLSTPIHVMQHSLLVASGRIMVLCFSMLLYSFRPYRLPASTGEYIEATAAYLNLRAELFKQNVNFEETFRHLLQQQLSFSISIPN
jgi:hypothetical protein